MLILNVLLFSKTVISEKDIRYTCYNVDKLLSFLQLVNKILIKWNKKSHVTYFLIKRVSIFIRRQRES